MWGKRCGLGSYHDAYGSKAGNTLTIDVNLHDACCWDGPYVLFNCIDNNDNVMSLDPAEDLLENVEVECAPTEFLELVDSGPFVNPSMTPAVGGGEIGKLELNTFCSIWTSGGENGIPVAEWCYQTESPYCN